MLQKRLQGMVAAAFTPFDRYGEVNLEIIDAYADYVASTSINGMFVCGTTGEFSSMTVTERKMVLEKWIAAARGRFKIIAHVGSNCQKDAIELTAHAAASGADAIGSIAPSFFRPATVTDLVSFFVPVAAAASELPFYYYNMPSMTGVNLPVDKFLREGRRAMPNLAGVKFTHNNLMEMGACIALDGGAFEVLHGYDEVLIAGLSLGAVAGIGSTYNYIPGVYQGIFDAMSHDEVEKARALQLKSIRMVEIIIKYGGGVRGGKAVMKHIGIDCGDCRMPFTPFSEEEYKQLDADLRDFGFPNP
jgi:N-acetylneuraminate lyase